MYKIIVIIRFHCIVFNNTRAVLSCLLWYFIIIVCEHLNSLQWPRCPGQARPRLQHRQVLTAASVCGRRQTPGARQSGSRCPGLSCRACAHHALYITRAGGATGHPPELCTLCVAPWPSSWSLLLLMEHAHACNPALPWQAVTQNCHGVKWYNELDS